MAPYTARAGLLGALLLVLVAGNPAGPCSCPDDEREPRAVAGTLTDLLYHSDRTMLA